MFSAEPTICAFVWISAANIEVMQLLASLPKLLTFILEKIYKPFDFRLD